MWIGTHVVIMPGVEVGDGAIIGAGAIVTQNVPPYAIVVGMPAKTVKYRFEKDMIKDLLEIKWWNWERSEIEDHLTFFQGKLTREKLTKIRDRHL